MRTVGLYTLGCKVSQYETEAISEAFEARGFCVLPPTEACDAYVINTCTVTAESDRKCRQTVRRVIRLNPNAVVAVVGCYSQRKPQEAMAIDGVLVVLGTADKLTVVDRVCERLDGLTSAGYIGVRDVGRCEFESMRITHAPRTRAYVKIEDGCESKCTYCAISAARGCVRSKKREDVIAEVEGLAASGCAEVVLTGIETAAYGRDFANGYGLADLICELDRRGSCRRLRLGSLAPELIGADFAAKVADTHILAPHFHLSMQSGSDGVLRRMKRRYSIEGALKNIDRLREVFPRAEFTTDMMVGFPGESEEDFELSKELVRHVRFIDVHVFAFSPREGTAAAEFEDQIDEATKRRRSAELIALKNEVRDGVLRDICRRGDPMSAVLETEWDGIFTAHSDTFAELRINANGYKQGDMVTVIPVSSSDGVIEARIVDEHRS